MQPGCIPSSLHEKPGGHIIGFPCLDICSAEVRKSNVLTIHALSYRRPLAKSYTVAFIYRPCFALCHFVIDMVFGRGIQSNIRGKIAEAIYDCPLMSNGIIDR
jgi:hypothetical protein